MSYDVIARELHSGAGELREVVSGMAGYDLAITNAGPDSLGHVELASWLKAVAEQCDLAGQALHDGAMGIAGAVDTAGNTYQNSDESNAFNIVELGNGPLFGGPGAGTP